MNLKVRVCGLLFSLLCGVPSAADDMATLKRLSDVVTEQCLRHYSIDTNDSIAHLQNKRMSEVDKLACAFPYAFNKVNKRLAKLEELDPASAWGPKTYVTLASRIYNFDYLVNVPRGEIKSDIMGLHSDLLTLHRILKQLTPYALSLSYPHLSKSNRDLTLAARIAAASASELTPWSALLRQANGTDCYGPDKEKCNKNKAAAFQQLLQAIQLLSKKEGTFNYIVEYSKTSEASEITSAPLIRIALDIQKSLSGGKAEYILGPKISNKWWTIRPDLRDTLNYLAASDKDIEVKINRLVFIEDFNCSVVFFNLYALANEHESNEVRKALKPFNIFEEAIKADPSLKADALKRQNLIRAQDCAQLEDLEKELNLHGFLSRFQAYQIRKILLSSHDDGLSAESLKVHSKRYALLTDIEQVIKEVQGKAKVSGIIIEPITSQVPQQLVDYVLSTIKGDAK